MFKYQAQIKTLNDCDIKCPPTDIYCSDMVLYRYFHDTGCTLNKNNHLPVGIIKPQRKLEKSDKCDSLAALSCFESLRQAEVFFNHLSQTNTNISKSLGCCLGEFNITEQDGARTSANEFGHFNFFEYQGTNLSSCCHGIFSMKKCDI